jgi:uncharacterized damage-inducible protein DinB
MNKDDIQLLYKYDRWANSRVLSVVSALSDEQFTRDLGGSFRSVRDTLVHIIAGEWGSSLAHLMQHLANHSTYHRGQIALMMRQLGAEPVATDFHVFLVERRHESASPH